VKKFWRSRPSPYPLPRGERVKRRGCLPLPREGERAG